MQPLESIFAEQEHAYAAGQNEAYGDTTEVFVRFSIDESWFMVPIDKVRVVVDHPIIVPYPERVDGHLGVASLRGEVLPVMSVGSTSGGKTAQNPESRLMFLEFVPGAAFGILVERPKKVHLSSVQIGNLRIVNVGGEPTHLIDEASALIGEKAA